MSRSRCDDCLTSFDDNDLSPIKDYHQRVEPGGIVPTGECPECGALAYPVPEFTLYPNENDTEIVYQGTPTYGQELIWIPIVTKDGQVGLAIKRLETDQEEYIYFNPSVDERNVFIYHGNELSVNQDGTECFINVAEGWDD